MGTNLIAVDAHLAKAKDYAAQGDDYYVRAGREAQKAKDACENNFEFEKAIRRAKLNTETVRKWITLAEKTPEELATFREDRASADKIRRNLGAARPQEIYNKSKDLPRADVSEGELHEARQGFRAMIRRAEKSGDAGDWRKSREQRTVAFAHFKLLLSQSNLPQLMKMSVDEIIELIRTI